MEMILAAHLRVYTFKYDLRNYSAMNMGDVECAAGQPVSSFFGFL